MEEKREKDGPTDRRQVNLLRGGLADHDGGHVESCRMENRRRRTHVADPYQRDSQPEAGRESTHRPQIYTYSHVNQYTCV